MNNFGESLPENKVVRLQETAAGCFTRLNCSSRCVPVDSWERVQILTRQSRRRPSGRITCSWWTWGAKSSESSTTAACNSDCTAPLA